MRRVFLAVLLAAASFAAAACGSSSNSNTASSGGTSGAGQSAAVSNEQAKFPPVVTAPATAKKGGTLTAIANSDVDYIDPGAAYYQPTYMIDLAADSPLMGWPPNDTAAPQPLLASGQPVVSNGGKTITFHIKTNVKYSPPLGGGAGWTKPVVAADVKYAIERGLLPGVPNGYVTLYLSDLNGLAAAEAAVKKDPTKAPNISGITTPDSSTVVFNLSKPSSIGVIDALSLPLSSPVPQGYAAQYDSKTPSSTYGEHQIDVGPYYISDYSPGKQIVLLRNPSWTPGEDFRAAYLDKIVVQEGFSDENSAISKILTGQSMTNFDFGATGEALKLAATKYPKQLTLTPDGANRLRHAEHEQAPVQQHRRAEGGDRGLRSRGAAGHPWWTAQRSPRDALHPAGNRGLPAGRRCRRPDGLAVRLPPTSHRGHGARRVVHEEGGLLER